jgi:hypothetical protein
MTLDATKEVPALVAGARRVARFMETLDDAGLAGAFASTDVVIVENFPPFVFHGAGAVERWAAAFRAHIRDLGELRHVFDAPFEAVVSGERAYLSLPTTWTGMAQGRAFTERGGWAFALVQEGGAWRVGGYGWAPTSRADG